MNDLFNINNIKKSTKRIGKYEEVIISQLESYFIKQGYLTVPHARFDIAWGSIISDIDLLLVKDDKLILIEVKSSRDNLSRAKNQLREIEDFVDEFYLATDYFPRKWPNKKEAGRIIVQNGEVMIVKEAKSIDNMPKVRTLLSLRKESLSKLLDKPENETKKLTKSQLANMIMEKDPQQLKNQIKEVITCQL